SPLNSAVGLDETVGLLTGNLKRRSLLVRVAASIFDRWIGAIRWLLSAVTMGVEWIVGLVYDERGRFSPLQPVITMARWLWTPGGRKGEDDLVGGEKSGGLETTEEHYIDDKPSALTVSEKTHSRTPSVDSSHTESESPGPRRSI